LLPGGNVILMETWGVAKHRINVIGNVESTYGVTALRGDGRDE
jgi:hypothetical protein